jgi:hypothetical protein
MDKSIAYDVYHPDLKTLGITAAVCTEVGQVEHDGKGGATASFGLLEYRPAKKKPAKKPQSKTNSGGVGGLGADLIAGGAAGGAANSDPNADAKAYLDKLGKQAYPSSWDEP